MLYRKLFRSFQYTNAPPLFKHHTGNRLFIVLYADDGQHWKLKADVSSVAKGIHRYLDDFDAHQVHQLANGAKADVMWYMD